MPRADEVISDLVRLVSDIVGGDACGNVLAAMSHAPADATNGLGTTSDTSEAERPSEGPYTKDRGMGTFDWISIVLDLYSKETGASLSEAVCDFEDEEVFSYLAASHARLSKVLASDVAAFLAIVLDDGDPGEDVSARSAEELHAYLRRFLAAYTAETGFSLKGAFADAEEHGTLGFIAEGFELVKAVPPESLAVLIDTILDFEDAQED